MSPETDESRIRALEREQARMDQRLSDLATDVHGLVPLVVGVAQLQGSMERLKTDVEQIKTLLDDRDKQATDERKSVKVAMISLIAVILAALIAAGATIIVGM